MPDLLAQLPVTRDDKIGCLRRELKLRDQVYPYRILKGKMSRDDAEREKRVMRAILDDYERETALWRGK